MKSLAVLTTIPARAHVLDRVVASIEPQVDELIVHVDHPLGAFGKLSHAHIKDRLYFLLDDDLVYPPDYVAVMRQWVEWWDRKALVCVHGRTMPPHAQWWQEADFAKELGTFHASPGRWVNWTGTCGMACYTDTLGMTEADCAGPRNNEETWMALWAQRHQLPAWVVPHAAGWLTDLKPGGPTIFATHQAVDMLPRNILLKDFRGPWQVYTVEKPLP